MATIIDPVTHPRAPSPLPRGRQAVHAVATEWLIFLAARSWSLTDLVARAVGPRPRRLRADLRPWWLSHHDPSVRALARLAEQIENALAELHGEDDPDGASEPDGSDAEGDGRKFDIPF